MYVQLSSNVNRASSADVVEREVVDKVLDVVSLHLSMPSIKTSAGGNGFTCFGPEAVVMLVVLEGSKDISEVKMF